MKRGIARIGWLALDAGRQARYRQSQKEKVKAGRGEHG
jgi:hypothetical protein